jgi:1-deoxy-D-xylulose-5-phosphate reductoisomerase
MTAPRRLILLGSSGSIGRNVIEVVEHLHAATEHRFEIVGLVAGSNAAVLREQALRLGVSHVGLADADRVSMLEGCDRVYCGPDAALELLEEVARPGDLVVGAMVGSAGVPATLAAIERGCDIALANKETLVAAGALVMPKVRQKGVELLPIDSEHSAIFQCLRSGRSVDEVKRLVVTASGGPFRTWSRERLQHATVDEALNHPTWSMGPKITIDSATMMNKALELIEAHWLFDLPAEKIRAIVHPESIIHSFVEFIDGSILAQLGPPDMRTPIQYALTWPHRAEGCSRTMDWSSLSRLSFEPVDLERFGAVGLADRVIRAEGTAGAILNGANEAAVAAFLAGRIHFGRITELVKQALDAIESTTIVSANDVMEADRSVRELVEATVAQEVPVVGGVPTRQRGLGRI